MNYESIKVGDVDLRVGFKWGVLGFTRYFPEANGKHIATLNVDIGFSLDGSECRPEYSGREMNIWVSDGVGMTLDLFHIVRHIGYLAGDVSERYRFCHAAGLKLNGKGVMLAGNSGSGKSTLASILGGKILDDDILMASTSELRRIAKVGGRINPERGTVKWIEDDNYQSPLHYVFLLDNRYDPDHVVQVQPSVVSPEITFDDKLHPSLLEAYKRRMPLAFEVPIFEVGTKREPTETKKVIEEIVSK